MYNNFMFYFEKINDKTVMKSDLTELNHLFTTRETCIKSEELPMIANQNKEMIRKYLHAKEIVSPKQTHSANVDFAAFGKTDYPETDALILDNEFQAVFLNFADCTPIILYDKDRHIGAVCHAGWRGTAKRIAVKTLEKMGSKNVQAIIGPAISICCYNVGEDVFNELKNSVNDFEGLYREVNGELFVDLKGINARQLQEFGVKEIDVCPYCTSCDNDLFFSYRKENGTKNRHSAVIKL